jgi:hypothetical protein
MLDRLAILKNRNDSRPKSQNLLLMSKSFYWGDAEEVMKKSGHSMDFADVGRISSIIFHSCRSGISLVWVKTALVAILDGCRNDPIATRGVLRALEDTSWHPDLLNSALNGLMEARSKDAGAIRNSAEEIIRTATEISIRSGAVKGRE